MTDHILEGRTCWCHPRVEQVCRDCQGDEGHLACQRCAGTGWEAAYDADAPAVVIHNDVTLA